MRTIKKYSCYEYEIKICEDIFPTMTYHWVYIIFGTGCQPYDDGLIESDEWYKSESDAELACIAHIDRLENGE